MIFFKNVSPPPKPSPYSKKGPWKTSLTPEEEKAFVEWVTKNKIPYDLHDQFPDYDMRGFWKAMLAGKAQQSVNMHFPDTWKTPYHKSFSRESMYALPDAPHWKGGKLIDRHGKVLFQEPYMTGPK